jgi:hypothetical protein
MGLLEDLEFLKKQRKPNLLANTRQLQGPAEPYLRQQYPEVYGALGGLLGMAPDEMAGSVLDPNTARVRSGAEYGFPVGTAAQVLPMARPAQAAAMAAGRAGERLAERAVPRIMERGGMGAEMLQGMAQGSRSNALPPSGRSGIGAFDSRYDPRVQEQSRMQSMVRDIQLNPGATNAPKVSLADFEGRPFITSMSDRTAAGGNLIGIDDVSFNRPVGLLGGQDYMFNNPAVWASGERPAKALMKYAEEVKSATGQNPLYLPYRMAPTGGDFAQMTGETMLAYADSAMGKAQKNKLNKAIKKFIPDWVGVSNPESVNQFREVPDATRKAIKDMMDKNFRNEGGLNIGSARLAVSDPAQMAAQEGGVMNVGEIFAGQPIIKNSGHPAYPSAVPGRGIGTLTEDRNIFELLPDVVKARGIPDPLNPRPSDLRAMQMHPYAGILDEELLRRLGY